MAAGHRDAARSVLDDGEHGATLDLAGVERSYSGRRRHRARSRRPLLPTQPIQAPNATHRFSGGTYLLIRGPICSIDGDAATHHARHAGAELRIRGLLGVAEEDVTMIDHALKLQDFNSAQAALATPAIKDHVDAGALQ